MQLIYKVSAPTQSFQMFHLILSLFSSLLPISSPLLLCYYLNVFWFVIIFILAPCPLFAWSHTQLYILYQLFLSILFFCITIECKKREKWRSFSLIEHSHVCPSFFSLLLTSLFTTTTSSSSSSLSSSFFFLVFSSSSLYRSLDYALFWDTHKTQAKTVRFKQL